MVLNIATWNINSVRLRSDLVCKVLQNQEIDLIWRNSFATREIVELRNLILIGQLVTEDALNRKENKGLHYNSDIS